MPDKLIAFGDVHLQWQSMRIILDYARQNGIDTVLTLGDEEHWLYPFRSGGLEVERMWHELRAYRDEHEGRHLILTVGEKTAGVASDLLRHYVGVDPVSAEVSGSLVYRAGNILAAHNGQWILNEYSQMIQTYSGLEPLVIFHGHSHSMGVLPEYKWLQEDEFVYWLANGEEQHVLEPGNVYWVNPGYQLFQGVDGRMAANFATYDPTDMILTLRTILYYQEDIHPSPTPNGC